MQEIPGTTPWRLMCFSTITLVGMSQNLQAFAMSSQSQLSIIGWRRPDAELGIEQAEFLNTIPDKANIWSIHTAHLP